MRRTIHGVHQLAQALRDFSDENADNAIRAVDEDGIIKRLADGSTDQTVNDIYLRREFPPPGKAKAASPGDTATDRYNRALGVLEIALQSLDQTFTALTRVPGDDGQPMVDARGVEPRLTEAWRRLLARVDEEMIIWARTYRRTYGAKVGLPAETQEDEDEDDDIDPYAGDAEDASEDWPVVKTQMDTA
jgi:hypothetical protein